MKKEKIILTAVILFAVVFFIIIAVSILNLANKKTNGQLVNDSLVSKDEVKGVVDEKNNSTDSSGASDNEGGDVKNDGPLDLAKKNNDSNSCLVIKEEKYRDLCLILLAEHLNSDKPCHQVSAAGQQDCFDRVNYKIAIAENKINLCLEIKNEDLNYSCIVNLIDKNNYKTTDCDKLINESKKVCLSYLLLKDAKTPESCAKIVDEEIKNQCLVPDRFIEQQ